MIKFRKGYDLKIIALIISTVFLCNTIVYSDPLSYNGSLRIPSSFQNLATKRRITSIGNLFSEFKRRQVWNRKPVIAMAILLSLTQIISAQQEIPFQNGLIVKQGTTKVIVRDMYKEVTEYVGNKNPDVVAFGETHNTGWLKLFSEKILPSLADLGYKDLVIEHLFSNIPENEWQYAKEHKKIDDKDTPLLYQNINQVQGSDELISLIEQSIILGITLHGCLDPQIRGIFEDMHIITSNAENHIDRLLKENKKIAVYTGNIHNEIKIQQYHFGGMLTFGNYFFNKLGNKYLSIELVNPNFKISFFGSEDPLRGIVTQAESGKYKIIVNSSNEDNTVFVICPKKETIPTNYVFTVTTLKGIKKQLGYGWFMVNNKELSLEDASKLKPGDRIIFICASSDDKGRLEGEGMLNGQEYMIENIEEVVEKKKGESQSIGIEKQEKEIILNIPAIIKNMPKYNYLRHSL